jgi:hypothetical protein
MNHAILAVSIYLTPSVIVNTFDEQIIVTFANEGLLAADTSNDE